MEPQSTTTFEVTQSRRDLAAAHRLAVMDNLHEASWNHLSLSEAGDGRFLITPVGVHWSQVRASDLVELGPGDQPRLEMADDLMWVAYRIHAPIHWARADVRAVLHVHSPHVVALSMLEDAFFPAAEQNALELAHRIAWTPEYDGSAPQDIRHGEYLAAALGTKTILVMRNHGALVVGPTIGRAYTDLYLLDRAAQALVLALSTGRPIRPVPDEVVRRYADHHEDHAYKEAHFDAMKRVLDECEPDYRH